MKIALIPARGGSKRLPRKNIMPFGGRPMLKWTVEAAFSANIFDDVILSTEDEEIASVGDACGASIIHRPPEIADDASTLMDVLRHTIEYKPSITGVCLLLPNCPLRPASEIYRSHEIWKSISAPFLISVVDYGWTPPFRAHTMDDEGRLTALMPEYANKKSQLYPAAVCLSGAIKWCNADYLRDHPDSTSQNLYGFRMPWHLAIDIDTVEDMQLAKMVRFALENGFRFET